MVSVFVIWDMAKLWKTLTSALVRLSERVRGVPTIGLG